MNNIVTIDQWAGSVDQERWFTSVVTDGDTVVVHRRTEFADGKTMETVIAFDREDDLDRLIQALQAARSYSGSKS